MRATPYSAQRMRNSPNDRRHGTENGYAYYQCRCARCETAHDATRAAAALPDRFVPRFRADPDGPPPEGARISIDWNPVADHALMLTGTWIRVPGMASHATNIRRQRSGAFRPGPTGEWEIRTAGGDLWVRWSTDGR